MLKKRIILISHHIPLQMQFLLVVAFRDKELSIRVHWFLLMLVHKTVKQSPFRGALVTFLPASLPFSSSSSSKKLSRMLLSMLRTTAGCQVGRKDKHWQGTSIVLSSFDNQRIRASFDFPTVWVSPLWQHLVQTSNHMLSLLLYITVSPLLRIFFQTVGKGNFCAWGAESAPGY